MKRARNKVLLLLMVFVVTCFAVSVSMAQAQDPPYGPNGGTAVVFPYIVDNVPDLVTIVTVVVPSPSGSNSCAGELHYHYFWKPFTSTPSDASLTACCTESDFIGKTSPNDMVTFDSSGMFGNGEPLFYDTTSGGVNGNLNLTQPGPTIGYLVVELLSAKGNTSCSSGTELDGYLGGEAMILDIADGGAMGYRGWTKGEIQNSGSELWYGDMAVATAYPASVATTSFVVTPFNTYGDGSCAVASGSCLEPDIPGTATFDSSGGYPEGLLTCQKGAVQLVTIDSSDNVAGAIYDRNENSNSSTSPIEVSCIGVLTLTDLVGTVASVPAFVEEGGWAYLWNPIFTQGGAVPGDVLTWSNQEWVYKIESGAPLGYPGMINMMPYDGYAYTDDTAIGPLP